jgi:GNAT superfamily N-acetyltransferase
LSTSITTTAVIPANITIAPTYVGTLKLKKKTPPSLTPSLIEDTFTKISPSSRPLSLRIDPLFHSLHLTPGIATEKDIPELARLSLENIKEMGSSVFEEIQLSMQRRTAEEQRAYIKKIGIPKGIPENVFLPMMQTLYSLPTKDFVSFMESSLKMVGEQKVGIELLKLIKERFIDNPQGAYLVLKNTEGKIVATAAFNQFQNTHDFDMTMGNMKGLDPKHALETAVYVAPEYRKKGLAAALRKTLIDLAHQKGVTYLWSPTRAGTSSQRINEKLGYQKLLPEATFPDSSAFTPEKIKQLLQEYNLGARQLAWLKIKP